MVSVTIMILKTMAILVHVHRVSTARDVNSIIDLVNPILVGMTVHSKILIKIINEMIFLGICNETSNTEYQCSCSAGWEGNHCQNVINYCTDVSCLNNGVCRSSLMNYTCECLPDSYSGRHCEITANRIVIYQTISKSVGYIAILVVISAATLIVIMDLLKYCFGINPTRVQRKQIPRKRKTPVIIQYKYIHLLMPPKTAEIIDQSKV